MTTANHNPEHHEQMADRIPSHFADGVNILKMIEIFAERVQNIENTTYSMIVARQLNTAQGAQLNQYGAIVGQSREGRSDAEYRRIIRAKIAVNLSQGRRPDILNAMPAYVGANVLSMWLQDQYPAGYKLTFIVSASSELSEVDKKSIRTLAPLTTPSGVGYTLIETPDAGFFGFSNNAAETGALGFCSDDDRTIGGVFSKYI